MAIPSPAAPTGAGSIKAWTYYIGAHTPGLNPLNPLNYLAKYAALFNGNDTMGASLASLYAPDRLDRMRRILRVLYIIESDMSTLYPVYYAIDPAGACAFMGL